MTGKLSGARTRAKGAVALGLICAGLLAGCATGTADAPGDSASGGNAHGDADAVPEIVASSSPKLTDVYSATLERVIDMQEAQPVRIAVADLSIDMDVVDVGLEPDGYLEIPDSATTAGWYRFGAVPGSDDGVSLIAAHVDDARVGLGPFASLRDVEAGADIEVELDDGTTVAYTVSEIEQTSKENVDFGRIVRGSTGHHLVLVTCGGKFDWNTLHYEDNVIVWAESANG